MTMRFFSAYEAAEYAAKITDGWKTESGAYITTEELLGMMSVADEEGELDPENTQCYYLVTDDGAIGATNDGERMVMWLARPIGTAVSANAPQSQRSARFCSACGTPLDAGVRFCSKCGTPVGTEAVPQQAYTPTPQPTYTQPPQPAYVPASQPTDAREVRPHGGVGFSQVINDPRFLQAVKKNKKSNRGCACVFIAAPFVIMTLYTLISGELGVLYGMFLGAVVSAVFLIVYFLSTLKEKSQRSWDGTVVNKYEKTVRHWNKRSDGSDSDNYRDEPHGIIEVRGDDGKKHTIDERLDTTWANSYSYLQMGDRIRYHGKLGLMYPYEKYDKSKDEYVICALCRRRAPIVDADCPHCHNPILR